jgi:hypothetical protein
MRAGVTRAFGVDIGNIFYLFTLCSLSRKATKACASVDDLPSAPSSALCPAISQLSHVSPRLRLAHPYVFFLNLHHHAPDSLLGSSSSRTFLLLFPRNAIVFTCTGSRCCCRCRHPASRRGGVAPAVHPSVLVSSHYSLVLSPSLSRFYKAQTLAQGRRST